MQDNLHNKNLILASSPIHQLFKNYGQWKCRKN